MAYGSSAAPSPSATSSAAAMLERDVKPLLASSADELLDDELELAIVLTSAFLGDEVLPSLRDMATKQQARNV